MIRVDFIHYYRIGDLNISVSDSLLQMNDTLSQTFSIFETDKTETTQINIKYGYQLPNNISKELLFGNSDCMYPTYLYQFEDGNYQIDFYQDGDDRILSFIISKEWDEISLLHDDIPQDPYMLFSRLGSVLNLCFLKKDACVFHGVVMDYQGKGILVMASAGVGKSTHTNMWEEKEQALIINGDRCLCRRIDDTWYAYGMPWAGSSNKILDLRTKISDIVMIERDSYNHVEKLSDFEAEIKLLQRIFAPVSLEDLQDKAFEFVHDITTKVNVRRLCCLPNFESVDVLKEAIMKEQ